LVSQPYPWTLDLGRWTLVAGPWTLDASFWTLDMNATVAPARRPIQPPPVPDSPFPFHPGSLLSVDDLTLDEVSLILERASALEREDSLERARILAKRRVALLFYESSTRTRTSFELAAKALGADTTLISSLSSSIEKGESLKDTGLTIKALGAETIILRHNSSGAPWLLEEATRLPILNAGDGMHEHPTQALLDLRTILAHFDPETRICHPERSRSATQNGAVEGSAVRSAVQPFNRISADTLTGVTVTIVGDILHSRVARSNMRLLPRLGARVVLCGPPQLLPEIAAQTGPGVFIERDFLAALRQSTAVMMLRIQAERLAGLQLDLNEYKAGYQLTGERLRDYAPQALVLHPGPIIRGMELTAGVADGPQSTIVEQVRHGVAIRMAVVERALSATTTQGRL
jgi:aspartate carbamoyltransferase catalytic subunit